jgi:hypothetical protein
VEVREFDSGRTEFGQLAEWFERRALAQSLVMEVVPSAGADLVLFTLLTHHLRGGLMNSVASRLARSFVSTSLPYRRVS